ncbi:MAG: SRPBCC family protein [Gemmatimonadaceae bacterium]|nr:SRPBCC family protein [Gemmatimonadaceae bacterium]
MTALPVPSFNPDLDLELVRVVDVSPELVWKAYTTPALLKQWFCPKPWGVSECEIELRPGGRFFTVMQSPEGESFPNEGCYLEIVPGRRLVWTDALHAGFRPVDPAQTGAAGLFLTAIVTIEPEGSGTKYTAHVMHTDPASRQKHADMGFEAGWGAAFDQLVELMKTQ